METPNSPPMPSDEALIPTAKLGRPPIPGTEGTDDVGVGASAGAGDDGPSTATLIEAPALSSPVAVAAADNFEVKIRQKVSTNALNEVMLLNTVLLISMNSSRFVIFGSRAIFRDYALHCREGQMTKGRTRGNRHLLRFHFTLIWLIITFSALGSGQSQTEAANHGSCPASILPGVVIEKFEDDYSTAKAAGMKEGDVVLSWSQGEVGGVLDSPFALSAMVVEQFPMGSVVLKGSEGGQKKQWTLVKKYWGTLARPNFCGPALHEYEEISNLINAGKPVEASRRLRAASEMPENLQPAWVRPWLLFKAATLLAQAQKWTEADEAFQRATTLAGAASEISGQVLTAWGSSFFERSDWNNAADRLQAAVAIERQSGQTAAMATGMGNLVWVFRGRGDIIRAEEMARQVVEVWQAFAPNSIDTGSAYINLGAMQAEREDLVAAEDSYRKALVIYQKIAPRTVGAAYILNDLGEIARSRGDLTTAQKYFQQATELLRILDPGTRSFAVVLTNLASVVDPSSSGRKPEDYLREALAIMQKASPDGSPEEADIENSLGNLAALHDDSVSAEQHYRQALSLNEKLAPEGINIAETFDHLGDLRLHLNDLDNAEAFYRRAASIQELLIPGTLPHAESLAGLGTVAQRRNQIPEATALYERAVAALENQSAHLGGGGDVRAGFRAKYERYYTTYISLLTDQGQMIRAFGVSESSRARTLFETLATARIDISKGADASLIERQRSLQAQIKAKSAHRIEVLGGKHAEEEARGVEDEISKLSAEYQSVEEQIRISSPAYAALTQPQPLTARAIQEQLLDQDTLLLEYSLGEERSHVFAVTPDSLQAFELPKRADIEKQARLVYQLLTERNRNVKGETVGQREKRRAESANAYDVAAAELSRIVLAPMAPLMKSKRLVIVADGALHYVPFAALPEPVAAKEHANGESQTGKYATGAAARPLTISHEIVSLPSASVLALLRQQYKDRKPAPNAVAVLADPVFNRHDPRVAPKSALRTSKDASHTGKPKIGVQSSLAGQMDISRSATPRLRRKHQKDELDDALLASSFSENLLTRSAGDLGLSRNGQLALPRLRYTREEADAIYAVTPAAKGLEATDFRANRATATSPDLANYRIIHFATHGLLNSQHPELSGLVFSLVDKNGNAQDGFLTLQDIYNLNLPADLVVLSACETGLGKEISGEGLIGLTRGFMYAGASRVVASLWNVSDVATARLMAEFYRAMEKDGLPPAAAMRAAQIKMLQQKRWASPYYWAAFQIQGEWK
jgi:CHAT domain-containing protein